MDALVTYFDVNLCKDLNAMTLKGLHIVIVSVAKITLIACEMSDVAKNMYEMNQWIWCPTLFNVVGIQNNFVHIYFG